MEFITEFMRTTLCLKMKFVLESVAKGSCGRLGALIEIERFPDRSFKTPLLLHPNVQLSKEVLELSGLFDVTNDFAVSFPIYNVEQMEKAVELSKKTLAEFTGLNQHLNFMSLHSPAVFTPSGPHIRDAVPIFKKGGRINVTSERYMDMIEKFKPDMFTTLADSDTWFQNCPKKRVTKSCQRSEDFFDECLNRFNTSELLMKKSFMIGNVIGGYNKFERVKVAEQMRKHDESLQGYFIDGLHRNGNEATVGVDVTELKDVVSYTIGLLVEEKLRVCCGAYKPTVALELIKLGVDVLDSSYCQIVTNLNRAIVFNFDLKNPLKVFPEIDLLDEKFKEDFTAFVEGCQCLSCRNHTKAYTHHLLKTYELLGPMLLTIHNMFWYQKFFVAIQNAIKDGNLQELSELVGAQYDETSLNYEPPVKTIEKE